MSDNSARAQITQEMADLEAQAMNYHPRNHRSELLRAKASGLRDALYFLDQESPHCGSCGRGDGHAALCPGQLT